LRRSGRYATAEDGAGVTDEDMLQRAMRRQAAKNLDAEGTKLPSTSFTKFSDSKISSTLGSVGVSLGHTSEEISISANVLRHLEYDRLTVIPKVSTEAEVSSPEEEEDDVISDGRLLSTLVGGISEVDLEQSGLESFYDLKASRRSSKKSAEKKKKHRPSVAKKSKPVSR
jgi:hypothetical protein